jgi:dimethylamine/trimethylamine dehydrogenase
MELEVDIITGHALDRFDGERAGISCVHSGKTRELPVQFVVNVTLRAPNDGLFYELQRHFDNSKGYRPKSLRRIGDCEAPAIIAAAVYSGHRYARELETEVDTDNPAKYDRVFFEDD